MENIRKEKRAVSILLIFLMVMSLLMPLASGIANAASTITVTYGGGVYSYNSSGGKPAENIHGKFSRWRDSLLRRARYTYAYGRDGWRQSHIKHGRIYRY